MLFKWSLFVVSIVSCLNIFGEKQYDKSSLVLPEYKYFIEQNSSQETIESFLLNQPMDSQIGPVDIINVKIISLNKVIDAALENIERQGALLPGFTCSLIERHDLQRDMWPIAIGNTSENVEFPITSEKLRSKISPIFTALKLFGRTKIVKNLAPYYVGKYLTFELPPRMLEEKIGGQSYASDDFDDIWPVIINAIDDGYSVTAGVFGGKGTVPYYVSIVGYDTKLNNAIIFDPLDNSMYWIDYQTLQDWMTMMGDNDKPHAMHRYTHGEKQLVKTNFLKTFIGKSIVDEIKEFDTAKLGYELFNLMIHR